MADEDRACAEIHEGIKRLEGQLQDATTEIQNGINQLKSEDTGGKRKNGSGS